MAKNFGKFTKNKRQFSFTNDGTLNRSEKRMKCLEIFFVVL
jgi:hypothetical protein